MGAMCIAAGAPVAALTTVNWDAMVCGGQPSGLDLYRLVNRSTLPSSSGGAALSLFDNGLWYAGGGMPVPLNTELSLQAYYQKLPPQLRPHVQGLYQLSLQAKLPISFRVTQAVTPEGVAVPRFHFFKSTPLECNATGSGRGPLGLPSGSPPPSPLSLTVGMVGTAGVIIAYDHFVLKSLVDHGILPEEARVPALFGSVYLASMALHQLGLFATGPRAMLAHMPTFYGFQLLSYFLLEKAGMDLNSPVTQFAGLTLASMPYALAAVSPTTAHALGIRSSAALQASRGAAVLRVGAVLARALGWVGLIDLGARAGLWAFSRLAFSGDDRRQWDLIRLSQQVYLQERGQQMYGGRFLASALGTVITFFDNVRSAVDSDYEKNYDANLDRIQNQLVRGTRQFADSMLQNLAAFVMQATRNENKTWVIDWARVRSSVRQYYQNGKNAKNIKRAYKLVKDVTGFHPNAGEADTITEVIGLDGTIKDLKGFRHMLYRHIGKQFYRTHRRLEGKARALGMIQRNFGGGYHFLHPTHLSTEQRAFMKTEGARLTLRLLQLRHFKRALKAPTQGSS